MIFQNKYIDESKIVDRDYVQYPLKKGEYPNAEEVFYLYIECNLTKNDLKLFYNKSAAATYPAHFGIVKTKEQQIQAMKQTNLERYGATSSMMNEATQLKRRNTYMQNYGCEWALQARSVRSKIKATNLNRYGHEYVLQSDDIQAQIKATNLEKYGYENPMQSKEIQEKAKQTNLERYGYSCSLQNETVKDKAKQTLESRYGCLNSAQRNYAEETLAILTNPKLFQEFIQNSENKTIKGLAKALSVSETSIRTYCHNYNIWHLIDQYSSAPEMELAELFPNTFTKSRKVLAPYEIDLYNEEHKFGIEFNGNYWHSEQHGTDKNYHQKKSLLAEEKGIFLYHIWEYEWSDERKRSIIISQINNILGLNKERIFARKCNIEVLSFKQINDFLNENHIQGSCTSKVNLGLYHQGNLVAVMTFGSSRFDKNYQWELLRFCCKKNTSIIGGANKLMQHFIKSYNPQSIISYSHMDKGTGKLYEKLGFKLLRYTGPDYVWTNGYEVLSRYQCQKHVLLSQGFEGSSEREIMENRKFCRVFGCGNKVWICTIN